MSHVVSVGLLQVLMVLGANGQAGLLGVPPAAEDPAMAAVAPAQCLAYLTWAEAAQPNPTSDNRTEQLFGEPEVQKLIGAALEMIKKGILSKAEEGGPAAQQSAEEVYDLVMTLLRRSTAIYLSKFEPPSAGGPPTLAGGLIVNLGDDVDKIRGLIAKYQPLLGPNVETVKIGDRDFSRVQPAPDAPEFTWGIRGNYLIVGVGPGEADGMIQRMDQSPPAWLVAVRKRLPIERQSMMIFVNVRAALAKVNDSSEPQAVRAIEALGLNKITAYATVAGLDSGGYVSKTLVGVPGEPAGILAILKQKPLDAEDLAPLPKDAVAAVAFRMDFDAAWDKALAIASAIDQAEVDQFTAKVEAMEAQLGLKIREDLLKPLGDVWCLSSSPPQGPVPVPRVLAVVKLRDAKRFAATHEKLLALAESALADRPAGSGKIERRQLGDREIFTLQPGQPGVPVMPSWCVADDELVLAMAPQALQAYFDRGSDAGSLADVPVVAELLKSKNPPFALAYQDTPQMVRTAYPALPMALGLASGQLKEQGIEIDPTMLPQLDTLLKHLRPCVTSASWSEAGLQAMSTQTVPGENISSSTPVAIALLLPAVQAAREAARRAQSVNNLKMIGLALHNHHEAKRSLPPGYTTTKDGKPGLSWRVHLLPYLEEQALYQEFHLDEPWDSEHNRKLIERIPAVYVSPNYAGPRGKTNYLGIGGEKGLLGGAKAFRFPDVSDGTSNTIMAVEANNASAVEWTKPDPFVPDPDQPTSGLTGLRPGGFNALFADGSVRFLSENIDAATLKALFTRDGGEVVGEF